jgi:segregation and condensation protein B
MEARDKALEATYEVLSVQPISEATVEEIAEAVPGVAIVQDTFHEEVVPHRNGKLRHVVECILFVSSEPMTSKQIADTLDIEHERVEDALATLEEDLNCGHGVQLVRVAGAYQICTRPEFGDYCAMILAPAKRKLSKAALETLAVVAYRQPCTMPEIEAVRGVDVGGVMKTLSERGLVKEAGRKQAPGRPILYATTQEFLEYFGLNDVSELPDIDMLAVEAVKALEAQKELFQGEGQSEDSDSDHTPDLAASETE